ncbi:zinc ribbon domain-containing protein [Alteromonas pelagimontana]|uniref:Zinc ribbon domain-containing protein n=1 Tax=Alteromonas pelagimontana TaxID=1858656 RepID=A0A6M4MHQ4_9ALTE|nr:zinc ribbon domain-containing protein [Alteromonas pelagimontana]QJR82448.1 zinc ribbon domain-containing protein [Alteromonas pelagimontana]
MALIDCPSCNKKISDKAAVCPHCNFAVGDASSEDILRKQQMQRYKKLHSIQNQSMIAMLLFIAGFGFMYWGGTKPGDLQHNLAILASVVGFIWYVVNRVRILIIKRFSS